MKAHRNQRAVDLHNATTHVHDVAAVHRDKEDHATGHEHSRQALEHSPKSFLSSLDKDRTAVKRARVERAEP